MSFPDRYGDAHRNPKGPDDARPSALQIIKDEDLLGGFPSKTIFITGGSQGIGIETVRGLHATGANVYFTVRKGSDGEKVIKSVQESNSGLGIQVGKLEFLIMHLDDLGSVRTAAEEFLKKEEKLNILVNNAGVMATPFGKTKDGYETQFGINYIAHFYLFKLLEKALLAGSASSPDFASRVVNVSSIGHRAGTVRFDDYNFSTEGSYNPWTSYGQSKTALIWMSNYIDRNYGSQSQPKSPIHSWSLHPGGIWSNLQQHVPEEMISQWKSTPGVDLFMKSAQQGAATTVLAAVGKELEGKGGKYLADCRVMGAYKGSGVLTDADDGYATWAYSPEDEERLWNDTLRLLKLEK